MDTGGALGLRLCLCHVERVSPVPRLGVKDPGECGLPINCSLPQNFSASPARKFNFSTEDPLQDKASGSGTIPFHFFFLKLYASSVTRNKNVLS